MMRWRRCDKVQAVDALLLTGADASGRLAASLEGLPAAFHLLPRAEGEGWAAIFARALPRGSEPVLPRIAGALPLYCAYEDWWFPVGCELAVPAFAQGELLDALAAKAGFEPPVILVPRFDEAGGADAYEVILREAEQALG